jgi:hypothetical protein
MTRANDAMKNPSLPRHAARALLLLLAACQPPQDGADVTLTFGRIPRDLSGPCSGAATTSSEFMGEIDSLAITVSGPGMKTMSKTFSPGGTVAMDKVPVGENRTVLVQGFKATLAIWTGQAKRVKVTANATSEVNVLLTRVSDFTCSRNAMALARSFHTATALKDGRVLLAGGIDQDVAATNCTPSGGVCRSLTATNTADIFDPATGEFTPAGSFLNNARAFHTAALMDDGKVLIVGGATGGQINSSAPFPVIPSTSTVADIEVYDPVADRFEIVGQDVASSGRTFAASVAITKGASAGQVLVTGGGSPAAWRLPLPADPLANQADALRSTLLCATADGTVTCAAGPEMQMRRLGHTMTELSDGRVLVAGGSIENSGGSGAKQVPEFFNGLAFEDGAVDQANSGNNQFFGAAASLPGYAGVFLVGGLLRQDDTDALRFKAPEKQVWFYSEDQNFMAVGVMGSPNWDLTTPRYLLSVAHVNVKDQFNLAIVGGFTGLPSAWAPANNLELFVGRDGQLRQVTVGGVPRGLRQARGAMAAASLPSGAALFSGGVSCSNPPNCTYELLDTAEIYTDTERR